ncbi:MAG: hypothetical protein AAF517_15440 [Planctomycetota bacterium]
MKRLVAKLWIRSVLRRVLRDHRQSRREVLEVVEQERGERFERFGLAHPAGLHRQLVTMKLPRGVLGHRPEKLLGLLLEECGFNGTHPEKPEGLATRTEPDDQMRGDLVFEGLYVLRVVSFDEPIDELFRQVEPLLIARTKAAPRPRDQLKSLTLGVPNPQRDVVRGHRLLDEENESVAHLFRFVPNANDVQTFDPVGAVVKSPHEEMPPNPALNSTLHRGREQQRSQDREQDQIDSNRQEPSPLRDLADPGRDDTGEDQVEPDE